MAFFSAVMGALAGIKQIGEALSLLVGVATRIADDLNRMRAIAEMEEARRKARETGDTSDIEDQFRRRN